MYFADQQKHKAKIILECKQVAAFMLIFHPIQIGSFNAEVRIHIVNNPFDKKTVKPFILFHFYNLVSKANMYYKMNVLSTK